MDSGLASPRLIGRGLGLVVLLSAATNYTRAAALEQGTWSATEEGLDPALRLIREAILWGVALISINGLAAHKHRALGGIRISLGVFAAILAVTASLAATLLVNPQPPAAIVGGLRVAPLLLILTTLTHYAADDRLTIGRSVLRAAAFLILFETAWAAAQIVTNIPPLFGTTFVGPRPFGTFATPNVLGMAALGVLVLAAVVQIRFRAIAVAASLAVVFVSGSRTAMLGALLIALGTRAERVKYRWLLVPNVAVLVFVAYRGVSTESLSGRVISGEGRLALWQDALGSAMHSPIDWLFGAGVGYGSNAAATLLGGEEVTVTDSLFVAVLLSFGLCGFVALLAGLIHASRKLGVHAWTILPVTLLVALTVNLPEVAPINVLLTVAAGVAWDRCACRSGGASDLPPLAAVPHEGQRGTGASGGAAERRRSLVVRAQCR